MIENGLCAMLNKEKHNIFNKNSQNIFLCVDFFFPMLTGELEAVQGAEM